MILNGGILGKVRTQSVIGKGKALVHRAQSQKPGLTCSAEKRYRDGEPVSGRHPLPEGYSEQG